MKTDSTIDLSNMSTVDFEWASDDNISVGVIAQELGFAMPDPAVMVSSVANTVSITVPSYQYASVGSISTTSYDDMIERLEQRMAKLEKIIADEEALRAAHPAVKNAYDEYRFLAELAKSAPASDTNA